MDLFILNDKIEIILKDDSRIKGFIYDTKDEKLYVSISADDEDFKLSEVGDKVVATVYSKEEVIGFDATVTDRIFENNSLYELSSIRNMRRIQRRENIRVKLTENLKYIENENLFKLDMNKVKMKDLLESINGDLKEGLMLDLSAGGLKLSTRQDFDMGTRLILLIDIQDEQMLLKGKIVHKDINLVPNRTVYLYGIEFLKIKEDQEEKIIRHLFVMMRKNRIK